MLTANPNLQSFYSLTQRDFVDFLKMNNLSLELAPFYFQHIYNNVTKASFSQDFQTSIKNHFHFLLPEITQVQTSRDQTTKFLMKMSDGQKVETVLIPFHKRFTVCLSTQVGCAMNCRFCFTGTMGLKRHLKSHEIIGQYIVARDYLFKTFGNTQLDPSIVFMGQGEPLHNFDEVKKSIDIFLEEKGLYIGPRQMTLSTSGYLPGMKRLNELPQINIALSLHSPFNEQRQMLIPINQHFPLEDIFETLDKAPLKKNQYITYEYLLIDDFNDTKEHALQLSNWLSPRKAIINIIPFNPYPGSQFKRPSDLKIEAFKEMLVGYKLRTMVRMTKGNDILAACGQLNSNSSLN